MPVEGRKPEILCRNNEDNAVAVNLMERLRTLRSDSDYHGELLAMLCLPQNRDTIREGNPDQLALLFEMIDTYNEGHKMRIACIAKKDAEAGR